MQEKQQLLQAWVTSNENTDQVESKLKLTRSQEGELEKGRELLTIAEMKSRGFSTLPGRIHVTSEISTKVSSTKFHHVKLQLDPPFHD